jgi:hypothetical protein
MLIDRDKFVIPDDALAVLAEDKRDERFACGGQLHGVAVDSRKGRNST